jgi:hypothetical protein
MRRADTVVELHDGVLTQPRIHGRHAAPVEADA